MDPADVYEIRPAIIAVFMRAVFRHLERICTVYDRKRVIHQVLALRWTHNGYKRSGIAWLQEPVGIGRIESWRRDVGIWSQRWRAVNRTRLSVLIDRGHELLDIFSKFSL